MKIIKTNWINIIGVFISVFVYAVFLNISDENTSKSFFQSMLAALMLVCLYGIMFWALFIMSLIIFDLLFIVKTQNDFKLRLLVEWLVISSPFIYWTMRYKEWIFLVGIVAFLITQLLREKAIRTTVEPRERAPSAASGPPGN